MIFAQHDARPDASPVVSQTSRLPAAANPANVALLLLLCAVFMWLRWKKLDELLWGDPVHWLHEASRVARGELPYRDFSYQYPPLAVFYFGWGFRLFGTTFTAAQILIDFWSVAVVLLSYFLMTFLLPRALHLPVCFLLVSVCATSLTNFNLFSYRIYTPALEMGAAGALLLALGILRHLRQMQPAGVNRAMIAAGSAISLLSKPEYALAACAALLAFVFVGRRFGFTGKPGLKLLVGSVLPAAVLYAWLAFIVGPRNLIAGVSGYGLATFACPWWPTGVGIFGVCAALGEALMVAALVSLPWRDRFAARLGAAYRRLCVLAVPGAIVFAAYVCYLNRVALTSGRPAIEKIKLMLPSVVWTAPMLLPVMWVVIALFFYLILRSFSEARESTGELLVILTFPVIMSIRTLFGSTQSVYPDIAAACYPFLLILGPYLLWRFLSSVPAQGVTPAIPAAAIVSCLVLAYGAARIIGGASLLTGHNYRSLETEAGTVKIADHIPGVDIYHYVISHTSPSDYVLELPYGGGVNFASGRRNPAFDTQLFGMAMPPVYRQLDLQRIRERRPKLVIAEDSPEFGTYYGYGLKGNRSCVCPRLVWIPDRPSWDPDFIYPVVAYIAHNYRPTMRFGSKVILVPSEGAGE